MSEVKDDNTAKTLSAAARRSFFRRKHKHKRSGSKDGKDLLALDTFSSDSIPLFEGKCWAPSSRLQAWGWGASPWGFPEVPCFLCTCLEVGLQAGGMVLRVFRLQYVPSTLKVSLATIFLCTFSPVSGRRMSGLGGAWGGDSVCELLAVQV